MLAIEAVNWDSLRKFVRTTVIPHTNANKENHGSPLHIFEGLHKLGLFHTFIPLEYGGLGTNVQDLAVFARELSYGSLGLTISLCGNLLALTALSEYASKQIKEPVFKEFLEQLTFLSFCMTEPDAGTDVANIQTKAIKTKNGYSITGKKCFITNANLAKHFIVFARTENSISAFYVNGKTKGITRGKALKKLGQRDSDTGELFFDEVIIPASHLLGKEGDGLEILSRCVQKSKTLIAAAGVGISDRAYDLVVEHLHSRVRRDKTLLANPTIHSQLAQLQTEVEAAWLLTQNAARVWDTGNSASKEASMAKLFSAHTAMKFVTESLEFFGGYGFSTEYEIERLFRDVRGLEIFEGATLVQQKIIANELFGNLLRQTKTRKAA